MKKYLCLLITIFILCSILPQAAFADQKIDLNKEGSISIKVVEEGVALKDLKLTCIKIANIESSNNFYEYVGVYR